MCCRYYLDDSTSFLAPYAKSAADSPLTEKMAAKLGRTLVVRGEVRPTDMVPAVALGRQGTAGTFPMIWGYSGTGRKAPIFNARSESAGEKPMFAEEIHVAICCVCG